mmetsp:Transcript_16807/g.48826  ORF Transcript_16807/g.48826 Transcript_16807/m.48826 type:complete len:343 (+) Transcript_16807:246-1274(+)
MSAVHRFFGFFSSMPSSNFCTPQRLQCNSSKPGAVVMSKCSLIAFATRSPLSGPSPPRPRACTSVGTASPPNTILEKTRPNCQTLFETLFGTPSSTSGAWRAAGPQATQAMSSEAVPGRHALLRSDSTACTPLATKMLCSVKSPRTRPLAFRSRHVRRRSTNNGNATRSGTARSSKPLRCLSCFLIRASKSSSPGDSASTCTTSTEGSTAKISGTIPVPLNDMESSTWRNHEESEVRQIENATSTCGADASLARPLTSPPPPREPARYSMLPGSSLRTHRMGKAMCRASPVDASHASTSINFSPSRWPPAHDNASSISRSGCKGLGVWPAGGGKKNRRCLTS